MVPSIVIFLNRAMLMIKYTKVSRRPVMQILRMFLQVNAKSRGSAILKYNNWQLRGFKKTWFIILSEQTMRW